MGLAAEERAFWNDNGYLAIDGLFPVAEVEHLRVAADALTARGSGLTESNDRFKLQTFDDDGGSRVVQQVAEPHELGAEWMTLARDPRILNVIEDLLGPDIQLYYSMMMVKPARQGFRAPWHQDMAFFAHDRAALVACQVYLDDSTLDNGCVHVVPGSHKLGLINHYDGDRFASVVTGDVSHFDAQQVALPLMAGGAAFWHCLTLHSSPPNRSEHSRRGVTFEYKDPSARLMGGAFSRNEVRPCGLMVRGNDPTGELLSAI